MSTDTEPRSGHVMVNLRIDVEDAEALIEQGRMSLHRKYPGRYDAAEAADAIDTPEEAVVELLIEGWRSLPSSQLDLVADWGDVNDLEFYPADEDDDLDEDDEDTNA